MKKLLSLVLVIAMMSAVISTATFAAAPEDAAADRQYAAIESGKLNIVIDGGTEACKANPGSEVDVKIRLVNNTTISSLKLDLYYDSDLSVALNSKGKAKITLDIYDPDDESAMKRTDLFEDQNRVNINWLSAEDEVRGDTVFATVTFKVADDAERGAFLPITAQINPNDVFDMDQENIEFNLINGGVEIANHVPGPVEYDENNHWHKCVDCGETIDIGPHTFDETVSKKPTCTEAGELKRVCSVCGYTLTSEIAPLGHSISTIELGKTVDGMLNIVVDGGTSAVSAEPGEEVEVKVRLVNNRTISSLKMQLSYDENLSVVLNKKGNPVITLDIYNPDDESAMKKTALDAENRVIMINWLSAEDEVKGDTVYVTIKFKVSENAEKGAILPIIAEINPQDVFDIDQNDIPFNLISGGIYVGRFANGYECDGASHWHVCKVCGEKADNEAHTYGAPTVLKAATCTEDGKAEHTCTVCGYVEEYVIEKLGHDLGEVQCDAENHWYKCKRCSETVGLEAHYDEDNDGYCDVCKTPMSIKGDVNKDKEVNNKDVVALFRYLSVPGSVEIDLWAADFNNDGAVDNKDVVSLFRFLS